VSGPAPTTGLIYAKARAKPSFQTREQIERQVARGGLSALEAKDLWSSLFLTLNQVQEMLAHVQARGGRPWVHVAFCIASATVRDPAIPSRRPGLRRRDDHDSREEARPDARDDLP